MGRRKIEFTSKMIKKMEELALAGCQNNTIASIMEFDKCLIDQRKDIKKLLTKKRAERKYNLRIDQNKAASSGNPALLIFLGKNELDQRDTKDINLGGSVNIILERE